MGTPVNSDRIEAVPVPSGEALAELRAFFADVRRTRPDLTRQRDHLVGGRRVRTRTIGTRLADLHARGLLAAPDTGPADAPTGPTGTPELTVDIWDAHETDAGAPPCAVSDEPDERHGSGGERFATSADRRYACYRGPGFTLRHDRAEGRAVGWVTSYEQVSYWNRTRPWQPLLVPWLGHAGARVLHAALVGIDGRGVLVVGPNGTGKSTTSGACIEAGYEFLGDDAIALERDPAGRLIGHCIYPVVKLERKLSRSLPRLAAVATRCEDPTTDEVIAPVTISHPDAVRPSSEIVAVVLPSLSPQMASRVVPVGAIQALRSLTGSVLSAELGQIRADFGFLSELVDSIPAFQLELGRDPAGIAPALAALL